MQTFRRILVAIKEPGATNQIALKKAAQLARNSGAALELFHDLDVPLFVDTTGASSGGLRNEARELRARCCEQLEKLAKPLRKRGLKITTTAVWDYPAYEAIVRRVAATRADLIVAECRPGKHPAPFLLRLTDWELLRHSRVPVLLVKTPVLYGSPVILSAVDPSHARAKTSRLDEEIMNVSAALRRMLRGTLHAVHCYDPFPVSSTPSDILSPKVASRIDSEQEKLARQRLRKVTLRAGLEAKRRHVSRAFPHHAIPATAAAIGASIVVMGAVSRTGFRRLLIGNTAERILDDLACDVLVVKPPRFANRIPRARSGMRFAMPEMAPMF
jgi:universal stress protein E